MATRRIKEAFVASNGDGWRIRHGVFSEVRYRSASGRWEQRYWRGEKFDSREAAETRLAELQGRQEETP